MSDPLAQPLKDVRPELTIKGLNNLLAWYSSQEVHWYKKLWGNEAERESWSQGNESEWMRYRMEAASLRAGIVALGGEPDDSAYSGSEPESRS